MKSNNTLTHCKLQGMRVSIQRASIHNSLAFIGNGFDDKAAEPIAEIIRVLDAINLQTIVFVERFTDQLSYYPS